MTAKRWLLPMLFSLALAALVLVATKMIDVRVGFADNVANAAGLLENETAAKAKPAAAPFWRDGSGVAPADAPRGAPPSFADLAERVTPAVVFIQVERTEQAGERQGPRSPFEQFFGAPHAPIAGQGTGFLISADGYVVTNDHVVGEFDKIEVQLTGGETLPAKVIGRDAGTDLALLKIETERALPSLPLGDSERIRPGDWVVAIGNPFGLEHTVTAGIVSAKHRRRISEQEDSRRFDDFIQTDAAINPGNSGGPLLNLAGEVIGINAQIRAGGDNIGFAIPVNIAKQILPQLRAKGRVSRGKLGIGIQPVDPDAAELLGLTDAKGALVNSIEPGSPAEHAGVRVGDVIVEFNGQKVDEMDELPQLVAATAVGAKSKLTFVRKGKRQTVDVIVGALSTEDVALDDDSSGDSPAQSGAYGLSVQTLTADLVAQLRLEPETQGVVVTRVQPGTPAESARLQPYDVILEVNQAPVKTAAEFKTAVGKNPKGALLLVRRGRQEIFVTMRRAAK